MRISDWSSDVCSSDLHRAAEAQVALAHVLEVAHEAEGAGAADLADVVLGGEFDLGPRLRLGNRRVVEIDGEAQPEAVMRLEAGDLVAVAHFHRTRDADERSEEHTSELQSLMRISYAVFCLK